MGMYDYLGEDQVKCFYTPIFDDSSIISNMNNNQPCTWHSGGNLRGFDIGDELPLKELYYKYPNSLCIFDYRFDYEMVHIIKAGKYSKCKNYKEIIQEDMGDVVIDDYGNELNIKTPQDFIDIKTDYKKWRKADNELEKEYFPNGSFYEIKNNMERYDSLKDEYYSKCDKLKTDIMGKWIAEDKYELEKQFGEYLDCYEWIEGRKDEEITKWENPKQKYINYKNTFKEFIESNEGIVNKYIEWLEIEEDKELQGLIYSVIKEICKEE